MTKKITTAAVLGLALAPLLAGAGAAQQQHTVRMTPDLQFEPRVITVPVGATVVWVNDSPGMAHSATADPERESPTVPGTRALFPQGAEPFDSGMMPPGSTFEHTFDVPGRYIYFCITHKEENMIGEVIVE